MMRAKAYALESGWYREQVRPYGMPCSFFMLAASHASISVKLPIGSLLTNRQLDTYTHTATAVTEMKQSEIEVNGIRRQP